MLLPEFLDRYFSCGIMKILKFKFMKEKFFEGADFKNKYFKALIPIYYPPDYRRYIKEETVLLKRKIKGSNKILEAGVGIGRLIPELAPLVKKFIGIDVADLMLKQSRKISKKYKNVKIIKLNIEDAPNKFARNYFDYSLCVWNTLGNIKSEENVLKQLAKITAKSIFITVYKKGTLKKRKNWYKTVGVKIKKIDKRKEIFYSESGLKSKSYNLNDIKKIASRAKLKIADYKILNGVIFWIELTK